jgi:phosphohistidine phosphatase
MNLYLMRHAEALDLEAANVDRDADRPLSDKGQRQAARVGMALARLDVELDAVLTSPLVRARKTAQIVLKFMHANVAIRALEALAPNERAEVLWQTIAKEEAENMLVVGHLPSIGNLARSLLGSMAEQPLRFHKATIAALRCEPGDGTPRVSLEWMLSPVVAKRLSIHGRSTRA